jgi:adenylate cyclase
MVIAAVVLVFTGAAFYILRRPPTRDLAAVAVLPFVNGTGDARHDALAASLSDTLRADLADIPTLRVVSGGASSDGLVEGTLLRAGERVSVEVRIVDTAQRQVLWSERYERPFAELDAVQRQIARAVGAHLRGALARDYVGEPAAPPTSSSTR